MLFNFMKRPYQSSKMQGFTLIELLVTVAVAAILLAAGVPLLSGSIERNRVAAQMREFSNGFAYARSEAVSSNTFVTVCARATNSSCGTDWNNGLLIFNDNGDGGATRADGVLSGDEEVYRVLQSDGPNIVTATDASNASIRSAIFSSRGTLHGVVAGAALSLRPTRFSLTLCGQQGTSALARAIIFELTGRGIPSRDTGDDGIHEDASGGNIQC